MSQRYNRRYSKRARRRRSLWGWFLSSHFKKTRLLGGLLLLVVYAYVIYAIFVSPFSQRWRGIFGETLYPQGYSIRGIDVSHHQGDIDWDKVAHARIDSEPVSFVFIKATEGTTLKDEAFEHNFAETRRVGILCGCYHYFLPEKPARAQAEHFIRTVHLRNGDLPPVLDIEEAGNLKPDALRKAALEWLAIVEKHYHVKPIIYTGYKFKQKYLDVAWDYPVWIAHYYVDALRYDGRWDFWQHTDHGRIAGIKGHVDLNVYNGSMYNLRRLTLGADEPEEKKLSSFSNN